MSLEIHTILQGSVADTFQQHLAEIQKEMPWCDAEKLASWAINYYLKREAGKPYPPTVERNNDPEYDEFYNGEIDFEEDVL